MKYIATAEVFVAWFADAGLAHVDMAMLAALEPSHAGFIQFRETSNAARTYGGSGSLRLKAQPLNLQSVLYAGVDGGGYPVISNDLNALQRVAQNCAPAEWVLSTDGVEGNLAVMYATKRGLRHSVDEVNRQ